MISRRPVIVALLAAAAVVLAACEPSAPPPPSNRTEQSRAAAEAAQSVRYSGNAEIANIRRRLELTSNPNLLGFIVLFNDAGQPIRYDAVRGKVTSGSKRLTEPDRLITAGNGNAGTNMAVRQAPSDEGTWGSSTPYIYYWTVNGEYVQWDGRYMYSTHPIRLRVEPLVITVVNHDGPDPSLSRSAQ